MTQSAGAMNSRLCSTTTTVWPASISLSKTAQQPLHVVRVQARGRLVEEVERSPGAAGEERRGEGEALALAARERPRRLAECEVPETDVAQSGERLAHQRAVARGEALGPRSASSTLIASTSAMERPLATHVRASGP